MNYNIIIIGEFCCKKTKIAEILNLYLKEKYKKYSYISLFSRVKKIVRVLHNDESDFNLLFHIYNSFFKYNRLIWQNSILLNKYNKKNNYIFDDVYSKEELDKIMSWCPSIIIIVKISAKNRKKIYPNVKYIKSGINLKFISKIKPDIIIDLDDLALYNEEELRNFITDKFNDYINDQHTCWSNYIKK